MLNTLVASSVLLWLATLLNLVMLLALVRRTNTRPQSQSTLSPGQKAPKFAAQTLGGKTVTLADYAGRSVVFLFVMPSCGPCRAALPRYQRLQSQAARSGVEIVLISLADAHSTKIFVDELHIELPILVAATERNPLADDYQVPGTPAYYLIDAQGIVQSSGYPSFDYGGWKSLTESWGKVDISIAGTVTEERR